MSDELDDLKAALDAATPTPDPALKRENIAMAEKNFAALQGIGAAARLTDQKRPMGHLLTGVTTMLNALTTKGGLTASTALVAIGLIAIQPDLRNRAMDPLADLMPKGATSEVTFEESPVNEADGATAGLRTEQSPVNDALLVEDSETMILAEPMFDGAIAQTPMAAGERESLAASPLQRSRAAPQTAPVAGLVTGLSRQQDMADAPLVMPEAPQVDAPGNTEAFANADQNSLKIVAEDPVSTFSIDVDTASYSIVRSSLMAGRLPPRDAVRVEEIVNYFPYAYPAPKGPQPFEPTITVTPTPWNAGTNLVHIGIQGELPAIEDRPALNLVFLIDTSGSMQDANKLPLLKQSFRLLLSELRPEDEVSIVTYAGAAGQVLEPTRAAERSTILAALDRLEAGGSTAGQAGLQQAYQVAESMTETGEVTRVILATDGDFNVGLSDPAALEDFIAEKRETGTYLSVLGFGRGNLDDATMQALAQNGNGTAAYIDTLSEARKVLVDQLTGALFPIANDVKIQVEFNPAQVTEYRLIGYETRALNREDFNNDRVDAGDIGAGLQVTAIYEVTPLGSPATRNGPLRYQSEETTVANQSDELGFFKLRYKAPGAANSQLIEAPILPDALPAEGDVAFSIAMAGFGELLRDSAFLNGWGWDAATELAATHRGDDPFGYRAEALTLMRLAEALSR